MDLHLLADNLTNPALLFFFLGILAVQLKSDLEIPPNSSKFISLYLLFSIGFKGGQELSHSPYDPEILWSLLLGIFLAVFVPVYSYFILRRRFNVANSGAIAASYGSVSAVTFVTAISFLEIEQIPYGGHMVAVMALMEAPSIVVGMLLISIFDKKNGCAQPLPKVIRHSVTNGSVLLILGSLVIGFLASEHQAEGIKPFTTDIFKGFLAVFLLDMGITSGAELGALVKKGWFALVFAIGHAPAFMATVGLTSFDQIPPILITEMILLNGVLSILAAWLFRKYGFLAAIGIHVWTDVVWHVIYGAIIT